MVSSNVLSGTELSAGRAAISLVWLYQGFWCKVLGRAPRHEKVMGSVPMFRGGRARMSLVLLGWFETLLGFWVLSGRFSQTAAVVQIALLIGMNAGGLLWARKIIPDPAGMVFHNFAFLVLIWVCR
jgi:uncharacterized membrane protein YphA (DoxX/SURF4 family)